MKLQLRAAAIAGGIFWAVLVGGVGLLNWSFGYGEAFLAVVASIYPGFDGTRDLLDVLAGAGYAMADGAVAGLLLAWLYNLAAREK